jgi:AcrR family transcriptional regulator
MESRQRIIASAIYFFSRFGIKAVTMDFLAEQLGISKKTIYDIFKDKDELIRNCIHLMIDEHHLKIKEILDQSSNVIEAIYLISLRSRETYYQIHPLFFHDLKKYHPDQYNLLFSKDDFKNNSVIYEMIKKGIREGVFDKNINTGIVNIIWKELIFMLHDPDKFPAGTYPQQELMENIMYPFIKGLCTEKGMRLLERYFVKIGMEHI